MKRNRSEQVTNAVDQYIKKRQYVESEGSYKKSELKVLQTVEEMALVGMVQNEASCKNLVSYTCIGLDPVECEEQYSRFKVYIADAVEPMKSELTHLLFPMFLHLYLEMINGGHRSPARKFYNKHKSLFNRVPRYKTVLEELSSVTHPSELQNNTSILSIIENKYSVRLTEDTIQYLLRYLKNLENLLLLQIFNKDIDVKVILPESISLNLSNPIIKPEESSVKPVVKSSESCETATKDENTDSFQSLMEAIKMVRDSPPPLPSVCMYTNMNTTQGLASVSLSQNSNILAGGFEDSAVRLWKLEPKPFTQLSLEGPASNITLSCDEYLDIETNVIQPSTESKVLRGHMGPVYGMTFSDDSQIMLSCSEDTTVRAWSMDTFSTVAIYKGHNYPVWSIDLSPLNTYFATGSHDRTARLWTLERSFPLRVFAGHNMDVDCVCFHPNGSYLATGSSDRTVRLWNIHDGKVVRIFQGHRGSIYSLAFSPNGEMLATAGEDRRIRIWDLGQGTMQKELRGHGDTVYTLAFNQDSRLLSSGGMENMIRMWDVRKGISLENSSDGHTSPELLGMLPTKAASVQLLQYSMHNCLLAVGKQSL